MSSGVLKVHLEAAQFDALVHYALQNGFEREFPKAQAISKGEQNRAARWAIQQLANDCAGTLPLPKPKPASRARKARGA